MNFLFPYMARWRAINWTRYHQIFIHLAELGHQVHIIQAPSHDYVETNFQEIDVEIPDNIYLHEIEVNPFIWNHRFPADKLIKKGYYCLRSIKKVKEIIKEHKIDVLFLYNIPQYPLMQVNSCIKIFDLADDYMAMLEHELGKFNNPLILKIGESILNKMIEQSDITLSISKTLADSIKIKNNVHVLPNGVIFDGVAADCGASIREKYKKPIIGFLGSFEYFIDFDLMLNAAERLPNYTFLMVGTGREYQNVKNKIDAMGLKNVVLTGGCPHSEITKYIDAMDICLNIFKKIKISHSACPIKLFEYLSMKKPVISTRLNEIKNIDDGFLFYADTTEELVEAINYIMENEEVALEHSRKGSSVVRDKYQWPAITQKLLDIIKDASGMKGSR